MQLLQLQEESDLAVITKMFSDLIFVSQQEQQHSRTTRIHSHFIGDLFPDGEILHVQKGTDLILSSTSPETSSGVRHLFLICRLVAISISGATDIVHFS